jgi:polyhydroxyalkanoate synthesis regulator phasin
VLRSWKAISFQRKKLFATKTQPTGSCCIPSHRHCEQHCNTWCSALRQELGLLREQLEDMRQLKDQLEQSGTIEKEKAQRLSSALLQTESDLRDLTARYQQLLSKLTHAEAELDTLRRSEKDRSIQLQVGHVLHSFW